MQAQAELFEKLTTCGWEEFCETVEGHRKCRYRISDLPRAAKRTDYFSKASLKRFVDLVNDPIARKYYLGEAFSM